ncbi:radial spoke head 10 homolog B-like isoform X2 [Branchiostoma floridae x Branchiostoma japonicum]
MLYVLYMARATVYPEFKMAKGDKKKKDSAKKEAKSEPPPTETPSTEEKKEEDVPTENAEETATETETKVEEPLPREPTPEPDYDEPTLTDLIVEAFEGEKLRGLYEGDGVAKFAGEHVYEGQFTEGLMHGRGRYTWADGIVYEGDFYMNSVTGTGMYRWKDGSTYEGEVYEGLRHGQGTFKCSTKPCWYSGQWHMGRRHGHGVMYYSEDGASFYEGDWVQGIKQGWGRRVYKSGNVFEGQWMNNQRHGQGTMIWHSLNQRYEGTWENGVIHGFGTHTWFLKRVPGSQYPMRNEYTGEFVNGVRHGRGKFLFAGGAVYDGEWEDNKKYGWGVFTFKNGRIFEGQFENDHMLDHPTFSMDGTTTPDLTGIRTRTPPGYQEELMSVKSAESKNTLGPSLALNIRHLLDEFPEVDRDEEQNQVFCVVLRHISHLKRVYTFYASLGQEEVSDHDNTYIMSKLQFWRLLKDCKCHEKGVTLAEMDRMIARGKSPEEIHTPYEQMLLREYLDHLVTISYHLYQEELTEDEMATGRILATCFSKLIQNNILQYAGSVAGNFLYEPRRAVNALGYMEKCWEIYKLQCRQRRHLPHEPSMKMRQFLWMMMDYKLLNETLTSGQVLRILSTDDPKVSDGEDCNLELEMTFLEFFEGLIGCAVKYVTEDVLKNPSPQASEAGSQGGDMDESIASPASAMLHSRASQMSARGRENESPESASPDLGSPMARASTVDIKHDQSRKTLDTQPSGVLSSSHTDLNPVSSVVTQKVTSEHSPDHLKKSSSVTVPLEEDMSGLEQHRISMVSMGPSGETLEEVPDEEELEEDEEVMDESDRQFNFWTNQIHLFFIRRLFPAYEHMEMLKEETVRDRIRAAEEARLAAIKAEEDARARAQAAEEEALRKAQEELERPKTSETDVTAKEEDEVATTVTSKPSKSPPKEDRPSRKSRK